ncbi:Aspartate aminotransferase [Diplonema papillatum]|nr:Aspartate aminotransferase [Diplonema papillatum]
MFRRSAVRMSARFGNVQMGPPDPILGLTVAFKADTFDKKVNLGVGAYRDDNGKPFVLECVREAEKRVCGNYDHEYAGITGVPEFLPLSQKLLFGSELDGRICSAQAISGTGALRVAGDFLNRFWAGAKEIYVPSPTWGNHNPIFKDAGLAVKTYKYYKPETCGLNFDGMLADIKAMPKGSIVLLHACAHNPTGVDPTPEEWKKICDAVIEGGHFPFFDSAYQGFATGNIEQDAFAVRHFIERGCSMVVTQSFAKNMGLYGERIGAIHFVCADKEEKARVDSQLKILIRPMYSNPPIYGARLVSQILGDDNLRSAWEKEVKLMADRIIGMRTALNDELAALGSTKDWTHIEKQIGMFCFTGLTVEQSKRMVEEFHVYLTSNGRISMAGITSHNVKYIANAIHECTK